jgi:signal transduction histidine kinase
VSVELVHTQASEDTKRRCIRLLADALVLSRLTRAEVRAAYSEIEKARDALSRILDHADGKHA